MHTIVENRKEEWLSPTIARPAQLSLTYVASQSIITSTIKLESMATSDATWPRASDFLTSDFGSKVATSRDQLALEWLEELREVPNILNICS